jgi:DNA-binding response OmpR family regulator
MTPPQAKHALVVDDEPANRDFLKRLLEQAAFTVTAADCSKSALASAHTADGLALVVIDWELPDTTGLVLLKSLRAEQPGLTLIMATMHDDRAKVSEAFAAGCDVYLVKPHGFMELYRRLREAEHDPTLLKQIIIDQYGPRPYRGPAKINESRPAATAS